MTKLILWFATAVALIFGAVWLMDNPGTVSIHWFGYVLETSVAFCIGLIIVLTLAVYFLLFPWRWIRWIRSIVEKKKSTRAKEILVDILSNILCENTEPNIKLIKHFEKNTSKNSELVLMLKALSKTDPAVYSSLIKNPKTEQAGWQGLIKEHIARGEVVLAGEEVEKLLTKNPKTVWVLKEAFGLFVLNNEWKRASDCLDLLYKQKAVSKEEYECQKAVLLVKLNKPVSAFKMCPGLPVAALGAAKAKPTKAEKIFRLSWEAQPSFEVYRAYVKLFARENSLAQYKRVLKLCEENKGARLNSLVIADAAANAKLWGEAKKELNSYLANYPLTTYVASQMARIEVEANHNVREAQKWMEKANAAESSPGYICSACGHKTDAWAASCPVCNAFGGLKVQ